MGPDSADYRVSTLVVLETNITKKPATAWVMSNFPAVRGKGIPGRGCHTGNRIWQVWRAEFFPVPSTEFVELSYTCKSFGLVQMHAPMLEARKETRSLPGPKPTVTGDVSILCGTGKLGEKQGTAGK